MTTLEEILKTIRLWKLEAGDHHNDGWVMQGYNDKLQQLWDELSHYSEVEEKNK